MKTPVIIRIGRRYGRLTVLKFFGTVKCMPKFLCRCICGTLCKVSAYCLNSGQTKSCGCLHRELLGNARRTHGMTGTKLHWIWKGMLQRCYNKKHISYPYYGARGIKVCARWRRSFISFLKDVGARTSFRHSLERIDNEGDYKPSNVKWATYKEQRRNTRSAKYITFQGKTLPMSDWAKLLGMNPSTLSIRLKRWSIEEALSIPYCAKAKCWRKRKLSSA